MLIPTHASDQSPPADFGFPNTAGLCRLSPVPAGRWPFPMLSLQSLYSCLDPYPAALFRCSCPFLPGRRRPHDTVYSFGVRENPCNATSTGRVFRGCSHSLMFRPPYLLGPRVAPTVAHSARQLGRIHHAELELLPSQAVASLLDRTGQLSRLDFHQPDCSLVGRSVGIELGRAHL